MKKIIAKKVNMTQIFDEIHKRLIDIVNPSGKVIEALTNMSLPSGVNIDVKLI